MSEIIDSIHNSLQTLKKDLPEIKEEEVIIFISHLKTISDKKRLDGLKDTTLNLYDKWIPSRHTVKEILDNRLDLDDLKYCIEDFRRFAQSKGWGVNDNLDTKLITHIKIMVSQSKITLRPALYT